MFKSWLRFFFDQSDGAVSAVIARRQRAQIAVNPSNTEVTVATERIAQEKAGGESSKATSEKERQALVKQQIEIEKQLERDTSELKQAQIDLAQTTIAATADGIVSQLNLRNPRQTVRAGEELVQIVPTNAPQVLKAAVASENQSKLKIGQKVQMRVSYNQAHVHVEAAGGGDIAINARNIDILAGSLLNAGIAKGLGKPEATAGDITLNATGEIKDSGSKIRNFVSEDSKGNGGNITIDSGDFSLRDGAALSASTYGQGNAGNIRINAKDAITVSGSSQKTGFSSALLTYTDYNSQGKGGDITVNTNIFRIFDGALLDARTRNNQKGGDITVNANVFEALKGGQLTTTTSSNGRAGKITVNADDQLIISGIDPSYSDRITNFPDNVANIGSNSGLFVSSTGSGITGDIEINSPKITLDNQGKLKAESASGNGGNIDLNSDLLLLRRNSQISTNAGTEKLGGNGGNININSRFIVAVPKENSDITANAFTGKGGRVDITINGIFGLVPQKSPTENSDITASSELGVSGEVTINSPDTDPSRGLIQLPSNLVDASQQIAQSYTPTRGQKASRFIATGRGGLPLSPNEPLRGQAVITGWVDLPPQATPRVTD